MHLPNGHDLPYVAGLAGAGVLLLGLLGGWLRGRRNLRRRLTALALRVTDEPGSVGGRTETLFSHVERGVDRVIERAHESDASAALLAGALDAVPWAVAVSDEEGRPAYRNRSADALAAGGRADAIVRRAMDEQLASPGPAERTLEVLDAPARTVSLRSAPVDDGRRVVGAVVVVEDLTDRLRAERAQRDLVANAGTALRAPIGAMVALAEMIADEGSRETVRKLAARLAREAVAADRLIDDLTELGRLERRGGGAAPPAVPVAPAVEGAVARVAPLARSRGVGLEVAGPAPGATVRTDAGQLGSAVFNLVENAVKYSPAGTTTRVETREDGADVEIVVSDEGAGIPAEEVDRIFERFYRVPRRGDDDPGGNGLGLSIVAGVARDQGGSVRVESCEGQGSTFILRLPLADTAAMEREWRSA